MIKENDIVEIMLDSLKGTIANVLWVVPNIRTRGALCKVRLWNKDGQIYYVKSDSLKLLYRYSDLRCIVFDDDSSFNLKTNINERIKKAQEKQVINAYYGYKNLKLNFAKVYPNKMILNNKVSEENKMDYEELENFNKENIAKGKLDVEEARANYEAKKAAEIYKALIDRKEYIERKLKFYNNLLKETNDKLKIFNKK